MWFFSKRSPISAEAEAQFTKECESLVDVINVLLDRQDSEASEEQRVEAVRVQAGPVSTVAAGASVSVESPRAEASDLLVQDVAAQLVSGWVRLSGTGGEHLGAPTCALIQVAGRDGIEPPVEAKVVDEVILAPVPLAPPEPAMVDPGDSLLLGMEPTEPWPHEVVKSSINNDDTVWQETDVVLVRRLQRWFVDDPGNPVRVHDVYAFSAEYERVLVEIAALVHAWIVLFGVVVRAEPQNFLTINTLFAITPLLLPGTRKRLMAALGNPVARSFLLEAYMSAIQCEDKVLSGGLFRG